MEGAIIGRCDWSVKTNQTSFAKDSLGVRRLAGQFAVLGQTTIPGQRFLFCVESHETPEANVFIRSMPCEGTMRQP